MKEGKFKKFTERTISKSEIFSNNNLLVNDTYYKINKKLSFESQLEEENCQRNIFVRYLEFLKITILFAILLNIYNLSKCLNIIDTPVRIINLFFLGFSYLFIKQVDIIKNSLLFTRVFLEFDLLINTLLNYNSTELYFTIIFLRFMYSMLYNILFTLSLDHSYYFYIINFLFIVVKLNYDSGIFLFVTFLFKTQSIIIILQLLIVLMIQYYVSIKNRHIWALFDSFKRSFYNIKNIYDEFPYPVFIISRKQLSIYYCNSKATELCDEIVKSSLIKKKIKYDKINFKDLFDKKISQKFIESEIEKCLNNDFIKYVDLPIIINSEIDIKEINEKNFSNLYSGELENIEWLRLYLYSCTFKCIDSICIYAYKNPDIKFSYFKENYDSLIIEEINKIIDNLDIICDRMNSPYENQSNKLDLKISKSPIITKDNFLKSPLIKTKSNFNSPYPEKREITSTNDIKIRNYLNIYTGSYYPFSKEFTYIYIFFLKNSLNYIYDMNLTLNVYNTLRMNKVYKDLSNLHFKNFVTYMIQYFYPISKSKNFTITNDLTSELDGEVSVIYEYYRVLLFNIIMFILNNSKDNETKKSILITIKHSKFIDAQSSYYRLTFKVIDENPIISHSALNEIMNQLKDKNIKNIDNHRNKLIDIGIIVTYYIVNTIFNSDLTVTSSSDNTYTLTTFINVSGRKEKDIKDDSKKVLSRYNHQSEIRIFKPPRIAYEEIYYSKIVEKIYKKIKNIKLNIPNDFKNQRRSQKNLKVIKIKTEKYDKGNNDAYDSEEDRDIILDKDLIIYTELSVKFLQLNTEKFKIKDNSKLKRLLEKNYKIRTAPIRRYNSGNNMKINKSIKWDDSYSRVKFSLIPRILIVEDSLIGRYSITTTLKHLNIQYKVDIAVNGIEAVKKFKLLLNQGYLFDFIFMDICLPEMNGIDATKEIRKIEETNGEKIHTNIVAVTVDGKNSIDEKIFDEYFEKPIKNSGKFLEYLQINLSEKRSNIMHLISSY